MADNNKPNVVDLVDKLKTQKELQEYARTQFVSLLQASKKIEALEQENLRLKAELVELSSTSVVTRIEKSAEQLTCEIEIAKLHQRSIGRELSMEDVKKLEILVKTLYNAKAKSREEAEAEFSPVNNADEQSLLEAAVVVTEDKT